jgi:hypothetical protein
LTAESKILEFFKKETNSSQPSVWTAFSVIGDNKDPKKRSIKYRSELYDGHALIVLSDTCKLEPLSAT